MPFVPGISGFFSKKDDEALPVASKRWLNEYSQLMHKNAVKVVGSNSPQSIEQGFIL
ncbi:hypothetical protein LN650_04690 [Klebsiella pneumoniae subsp. pneumoniae]|nr:hypothetical protein [Klebsiella pneumoniae subsp. pneumoniae]